jgi:DNA-binding CsgD family transcriptional regulator
VAWWIVAIFSLAIVIGLARTATQIPVIAPSTRVELARMGLAGVVTEETLGAADRVLKTLLITGFLAAAGIIFWRRSDDRSAVLLSAMLITVGVTNAFIDEMPDPPVLLRLYEILSDFLSLLVLYMFPDGRLIPRWAGWLLIPWLVVLILNQSDFMPGDSTEDILDILFLGTGILAQVHRYRAISTPDQRQQIKWVVFGVAALILILYALNLIDFTILLYYEPTSLAVLAYDIFFAFAQTFLLLILPLVLAISILRYHLWDIDFYINRSLVYGSLTVLLGLVFFGSALLLQTILSSQFTSRSTSVVLTASAVIIAILFQPARQRLQQFVDRRFFGIQSYVVPELLPANPAMPLVDPLSPRELDVLCLIDAGLSNREIAEQLFLTVGTVKWHTNNIYTKLSVKSRTQALARAREINLIS